LCEGLKKNLHHSGAKLAKSCVFPKGLAGERKKGEIGEKMSIKITENGTKGKSLEILCKYCKVETNHLVFASIEVNGFKEFGEDYHINWNSSYQIIKCSGCNDFSFRIETIDSEMDSYDKPEEIVYPERSKETISSKNFDVLPDNIDKLYQETINCYNANILTLCGAGVRAIVEAICLEKNIIDIDVEKKDSSGNITCIKRENNLEGKINGLFEKGILTKENAMILHNHRLLGNDAVHKMITPKKEELSIAISIIESILEYIYIIPYKGMKLTRNKKS
jgi:hypothetical protein